MTTLFTTPRTWSIEELITKSIMDTHIRDNFNALWVGESPGDMEYYLASNSKLRIPKGLYGQTLTMNSDSLAPEWSSLIKDRQGGSSTVYTTAGTTNYSMTSAKIQVGAGSVTTNTLNTRYHGTTTITFPVAYTNTPLIFLTSLYNDASAIFISLGATAVSSSTFTVKGITFTSGTVVPFSWMAIGE